VDVSGQWPLFGGWYGVGRYGYSLRDRRLLATLGGLEYNGGCWVARVVVERFATSLDSVNNTFFVQLELNGLSSIGSNPLDVLSRNIPGYGRINQSVANPVFGAD
jgi:LPS-assembly protein